MTATRTHALGRRIGPALTWFAVLGGAVGWSVHLLAAWSVDELACAGGHTQVVGVPLVAILWISVIGPALLAAAALSISWLVWRRGSAAARHRKDRAYSRTGMLGLLGLGANALFLAIIIAGGAAVLVLPVCQP